MFNSVNFANKPAFGTLLVKAQKANPEQVETLRKMHKDEEKKQTSCAKGIIEDDKEVRFLYVAPLGNKYTAFMPDSQEDINKALDKEDKQAAIYEKAGLEVRRDIFKLQNPLNKQIQPTWEADSIINQEDIPTANPFETSTLDKYVYI